MVRYSFPVRLFHSLLHAGLSRRSDATRFIKFPPRLMAFAAGNVTLMSDRNNPGHPQSVRIGTHHEEKMDVQVYRFLVLGMDSPEFQPQLRKRGLEIQSEGVARVSFPCIC